MFNPKTIKKSEIQNYNNFPNRFDLVIAVECLMHIKPKDLEIVIEKMWKVAKKHIIHIDYCPVVSRERFDLEYYNYRHWYNEIYDELKLNWSYLQIQPKSALFHILK